MLELSLAVGPVLAFTDRSAGAYNVLLSRLVVQVSPPPENVSELADAISMVVVSRVVVVVPNPVIFFLKSSVTTTSLLLLVNCCSMC